MREFMKCCRYCFGGSQPPQLQRSCAPDAIEISQEQYQREIGLETRTVFWWSLLGMLPAIETTVPVLVVTMQVHS